MNASDDFDLLDEYVATASHAAFDLLVKRHAGWVYAAALRRVRSADMADDVTQAAFIVLAQKAASISRRESLAAWLYRVVQYAAIDALRRRGTRQRHERLAARPERVSPEEEKQDVIENLDAALDTLNRREREAIILRFFDDRTLEQIGQLQRVAASTVQRRLERSLNRIGCQLRRKGIAAVPSTLGGTLMAIGKLQAPPIATAKLTAMATAAAALPATTPGPIGLAHGAMKAMTIMKIKIAAAALVAFAVLGTGGAVVTQYALAQARAPVAADVSQPQAARAITTPGPAKDVHASTSGDEQFAKQFKADWRQMTLSITSVNAANPDTKGQVNGESMTLEAAVTVLDTTNIVGFDRFGHFAVSKILDEDGLDITAVALPASAAAKWYAPLNYVQNFNSHTQQFEDVLQPQQFQIAFYPDGPFARPARRNGPSPNRLKRIEGSLTVLVYDQTEHVDVPFVANGNAVEIMPGYKAHFTTATRNGDWYNYDLSFVGLSDGSSAAANRLNNPASFDGQLQDGKSLPPWMIVDRYWIDATGKALSGNHHAPNFGGGVKESGSGSITGGDKIAAMRFIIAKGLHERKLPIALENIVVPRQRIAAESGR